MRRPSRGLFLTLLFAGCSSGAANEVLAPIPYSLGARPTLPFPTDEAAREDPATPTGLRLSIGPAGTNLGDADEAVYLFGPEFAEALNRFDGWTTLGPVYAPVPSDASLASVEDHLLLVDLGAPAIVATEKRAVGGATSYGRELRWIGARSPMPLRPKTRHAIVILDGLLGADGARFSRSPVFDALWRGEGEVPGEPDRVARARARLAGVRDALLVLGIEEDDVLLADTFTTQSIAEEAGVLTETYRSAPAPMIDLDGDRDSVPDVAAEPRALVGWPIDDGWEHPSVGGALRFAFDMPSVRASPTAPMSVDAREATIHGYERVQALLTVPKGAGPFPVVLYQHGIGSEKESLFRYAEGLAAAGCAGMAIDLPLHGSRTDRPGNASTLFINIVDPATVLDNFRQAEVERVRLVRAIDELAKIDVFGDGTRRLDPSRIFYLGTSLGSMVGAVGIGIEPRLEGAVLMVGGGTMLEFFDRFLGGFDLDSYQVELFVSVAQTVFDKGDPTNFAHLSTEKQVLLMQAMQDEAMPPRATVSLARAMSLPLVEPAHAPEVGLTVVAPPVERRGWTQFDPARHNLTWDPSHSPESFERSRAQLFGFIESWAATGTGVIR